MVSNTTQYFVTNENTVWFQWFVSLRCSTGPYVVTFMITLYLLLLLCTLYFQLTYKFDLYTDLVILFITWGLPVFSSPTDGHEFSQGGTVFW